MKQFYKPINLDMRNLCKSLVGIMFVLSIGGCLPPENNSSTQPNNIVVQVNRPVVHDTKPSQLEPLNPPALQQRKPDPVIEVTIPKPKRSSPAAKKHLKDLLPYRLGAAIKGGQMSRKDYSGTVYEYFNSITFENDQKMGGMQPKKGVFNFAAVDKVVNEAIKRGVRVHGHCLVWRNVPKWVTEFKGDKAAWEKLLKTHIQTVARHFAGRVTAWDVVNEAFVRGGKQEENIWSKNIGPDYINKAFIWAHEADPKSLKFYNDFDLQYTNSKTQAVLNWIEACKKNKIPLHGIGNQMHTDVNLNMSEFKNNTKRFIKTGLMIHISELDVSVGSATLNAEQQEKKTKAYKSIYRIIDEVVPVKQNYGVTAWGVDKEGWFKNVNAKSKGKPYVDDPLLLTDEMTESPAYKALVAAYSK